MPSLRWTRSGVNAFLKRSEPVSIVHFVTERCNARCGHCFVDFRNPCSPEQELSLDEIRQMTGTLGACLYNVNLTGGEPFLRTDLFDIAAAYLQNTTARSIIITTNGTQVDAVRSFLGKWTEAALPGRIKISISIDHFEDQHDENRRVPGAFRKAMETYRMIEDRNDDSVMPDIALTVTSGNANAILDVHQDLKERGIRHFSAILMREAGVVEVIDGKRQVIAAYQELSSRISADQRTLRVPARHRRWEWARRAKNQVVRESISAPAQLFRSRKDCRAGSLFGVITANGEVVPCEVIGRSGRIGNLRESGMDFMALWRSGGKTAEIEQFQRFCNTCTYECAWTVTIMTTPSLYPRMFSRLWKQA